MLLATPERFDHPDGWYWQPYEQKGYCRYNYFAKRAEMLDAYGADFVLVVGCGYGYLVDELVKLGIEAEGLDGSKWAIKQGKAKLRKVAGRLFVGDALSAESFSRWRHANVPVLITEDMLPCLTDEEIEHGLPIWRARANRIVHIVTPHIGKEGVASELNWKTAAEWRELLAPDEVVIEVTEET